MKLYKLVLFFACVAFFSGCEKTEKFHNTADQVGISKVTYFAVLTQSGDEYMAIIKGDTYTEPGVTAKEGDADIPVTVTGSVDNNTVGVYVLQYSATNKDGFSSSLSRTVAVLPAAELAGVDISGQYLYGGTTKSTITKLAPGFYNSSNVWGPNEIPSFIFTTDGSTLLLPVNSQSGYGPVSGTGTLDGAGNLIYKVNLINYGISNSTRTWKKA